MVIDDHAQDLRQRWRSCSIGPDPNDDMANQEHLRILAQGVEKWNQWREKNPDEKPDFCGADLSGADLSGANLWRANLRCTNLSGAVLDLADLCNADLRGANLTNASLVGAMLFNVKLKGSTLTGANLRSALRGRAKIINTVEELERVWGFGCSRSRKRSC